MQFTTCYTLNVGEHMRSKSGKHMLVTDIVESHEFFNTYNVRELSKWLLIRKFQIWSLRKTFK